jgi:aspartate-semialdehyde dehydrogenase
VGRVAPGAMGVTWELTAINARRSISVEESDESPTAHERTIAPDDLGELARADRAGTGELHVLRVAEDDTEKAVVDVLSDAEQLRERAARLGVDRVVVRSEPGLVSIRYLP